MLQAVLGEVIAWRRRFGRFLDLRDRGQMCLLKSPGYLGTVLTYTSENRWVADKDSQCTTR